MWGWSDWTRVWGWEGEDECGDGKDFFYWESIFKTHQQFFYLVMYFRIIVSSYYSIFYRAFIYFKKQFQRSVCNQNIFFVCFWTYVFELRSRMGICLLLDKLFSWRSSMGTGTFFFFFHILIRLRSSVGTGAICFCYYSYIIFTWVREIYMRVRKFFHLLLQIFFILSFRYFLH